MSHKKSGVAGLVIRKTFAVCVELAALYVLYNGLKSSHRTRYESGPIRVFGIAFCIAELIVVLALLYITVRYRENDPEIYTAIVLGPLFAFPIFLIYAFWEIADSFLGPGAFAVFLGVIADLSIFYFFFLRDRQGR